MNPPASGYSRFQSAMSDLSGEYIKPAWEAKKNGMVLTRPTDSAFDSLFLGFHEISNTVEALHLAEVIVGLAAPRSSKIKKDEYLKFLVGAYLQEVYILEQRLKSYAKKVCRLYNKPNEVQPITKLIQDVFGGIILTRGAHVHSKRYSDQQLDALSNLTFISTYKKEFLEEMHFEYKFVQTYWRKTIKSNNAATHKFLNIYFDFLFAHISRSGKLTLPRTGKGK